MTAVRTRVAIIGSGNIGTDLVIKVIRLSGVLEVAAFVGIDPESDRLRRAVRLGYPGRPGASTARRHGRVRIDRHRFRRDLAT